MGRFGVERYQKPSFEYVKFERIQAVRSRQSGCMNPEFREKLWADGGIWESAACM